MVPVHTLVTLTGAVRTLWRQPFCIHEVGDNVAVDVDSTCALVLGLTYGPVEVTLLKISPS